MNTLSHLELPEDARSALGAILKASNVSPVLVMKLSPICPVSHRAEARYRAWLREVANAQIQIVELDVIAQRSVARGLVAELGVQHESPQALLFKNGTLSWHRSHDAITAEALNSALASS
jgi:bacillithiol system protein YtxJ